MHTSRNVWLTLCAFLDHRAAFLHIGGRYETKNSLGVQESHHAIWLADLHDVALMATIDDHTHHRTTDVSRQQGLWSVV